MYKLIFLFVALLATLASVNAQTAAATPSTSLSQTVTGPPTTSTSLSSSVSLSNTVSITTSTSLSSSISASLSVTGSGSMTTSNTNTISGTATASATRTASQTGSDTPSVSSSFSNTPSDTQSVTQTGSISSSWSSSVSGAGSPSGSMSPAPPPASIAQVNAGCGAGRKQICVSWTRPLGVPASNYVVSVMGALGTKVYNFTHGETFAMITGLNPGTPYTVTVQTLYNGVLSAPATLTITTAAAGPKQVPSLGITGFSCRGVQGVKRHRNLICSWSNGSVAYTLINLRIKCTGMIGSGRVGKHHNVRTVVHSGLSSWTEKGFFAPSHCKVIANAAYSTGPGRRIVTVFNLV